MKWVTHETVAVGGAFLLGMPPEGLVGVFLGSILPDVLDQGLARLLVFRQLAFNCLHRGPTHWFGWWLAVFGGVFLQLRSFSSGPPIPLFVLGVGFGALIHVLLDMCTKTGVPIAPWTKKHMMSLGLCATGSLREYAFLAACLGGVAFLARNKLDAFVAEIGKIVGGV